MQPVSLRVLDHAKVGVKGLMHHLLKSEASIDSDQCSSSEQCVRRANVSNCAANASATSDMGQTRKCRVYDAESALAQ